MSDQKQEVAVLPNQNSGQKFGHEIMTKPQELKTLLNSPVFSQLKKLEASPLNIAMQYFEFEPQKPYRFVFLGISERPSPESGEMLNCVILVDENKDTFCNMSAILVGTFIDNRILPGTPVEITRIGEKKTQNGRAYTWRVLPLINPSSN